ncbi:hypothetical protein N7448_001602 [Penicillium atrosanguineum]|uniref:Uncharacterized protein n=1 Tax=Penicillium atrosanguineum TaxID=1132637 RepID=A0A9W9Q8F6_9EURO|nr:hypothetical protein N7526_004734 [Penicillium atrosanguineum]KAJ5150024.1 hypothetical protein N7448_001602 [Penicillium atrosanguineum]KAJ5324802.1 hypothetical protein N7476_003402 [Penicillium atrosanguineum]
MSEENKSNQSNPGFFGGLGNAVGSTANGATTTIGNTLGGLGSAAGGAAEGIGQTVSGATEGLGDATKGLGQTVNKALGLGEQKSGEQSKS